MGLNARSFCRRMVLVLAGALFLAGGKAQAAPGDAGSVVAEAGQCFVESHGVRSALNNGDGLNLGDMVEVPAGARLRVRLNDGSILSIASGTRLRIDEVTMRQGGGRSVRLSLMAGMLRAVVAAFSQPSKFEINTATGVAAVRSTDWFIETDAGATQVGVLGGRVVLTSAATGRSVEIPARWGARVEQGRDPVPGRVWSAAEFAAAIARTNTDPAR